MSINTGYRCLDIMLDAINECLDDKARLLHNQAETAEIQATDDIYDALMLVYKNMRRAVLGLGVADDE